jgi:hypothetical protein
MQFCIRSPCGQGYRFNLPFTTLCDVWQDMTGPGHKLRAVGALGLLPLLLAAGDDMCRLCAAPALSERAVSQREIPLTIEIITKLDFSRAALTGASGGAIELDPQGGGRRVNGGLIDLGGSALAGTAVVRGEPGRTVRIDLPASARMSSSNGGVIEIAGMRTSIGTNARLDSAGRLEFAFGGRLLIRGDVSGTFRARIPITAQYE